MKALPKQLVYAACISILLAIAFKLFGIDLTAVFEKYPFAPRSFLNFANSILLLSIALSVLRSE